MTHSDIPQRPAGQQATNRRATDPLPVDPRRVRVGSAPCSWGVWFPDDPRQLPWSRFLDEVAEAGYHWIELGPYGYLPTDPARLVAETARRGLAVSAGTVFTALHHGPAVWDTTWREVSAVAALARAAGAGHLVVIPEFWRDPATGRRIESPELTTEQFGQLATGMERLGHRLREDFDLTMVVHPHADTHVHDPDSVSRLLDATDATLVRLCLDTGHYTYCGGDSVHLMETYGERIGYLHLKQVDPAVLTEVLAEALPFGPAVRRGVMCEPPTGVPALEPVLAAAERLDVDLFAIVEQDMYPCPPDQPLPVARRTRRFLAGCGL